MQARFDSSHAPFRVQRSPWFTLALKDNHSQPYADARDFFADGRLTGFAAPVAHAETHEQGHGRIERRACWVTGDAAFLTYLDPDGRWAGLRSVRMVEAERRIGTERSVERRYYLSSLPADAKQMNRIVRTHWQIENQLHWVLDTAFGEDQCRVRMGAGAQNSALLRRVGCICSNATPPRRPASKHADSKPDGMRATSYTS